MNTSQEDPIAPDDVTLGASGSERAGDASRRGVASFHIVKYPAHGAPAGQSRLLLDRQHLARTQGLRFWRLLASGLGSPTSPRGYPIPNLKRVGLFAVWDEEAALDHFLVHSPVARRWHRCSDETWHVKLEPLGAHNLSGRLNPFSDLIARPIPSTDPGAMLTYATLRSRGVLPFYLSFPSVAAEVASQSGFVAGLFWTEITPRRPPLIGVGTFSLWHSLRDAMEFATGGAAHGTTRARSQQEGWFSESVFARFRPYASSGTWEGSDPLHLLDTNRPPAPSGSRSDSGYSEPRR
ncbi:MAG TPA: spheroidene monooxygenase [Actinomycetota bacterium]|nr:spheroidene monooxygenase [Actinomycetota bacterium]